MIQLPPSKSIGARYLVATYFSGTLPADPVFEENEDLMVMQQSLLEIYSDEEPIDYGDTPIDVGASGTALRFIMAVCASSPGADYVITGSQRLMERPVAPLVGLLREAGAKVEALGNDFKGPYRVKGANLKGGEFSIRGDVSSQFISAVMLVAPTWEKGVKLNFTTPLISRPYVTMTAEILKKFGIRVNLSDSYVNVSPGKYREPVDFRVESDWSSASFFYEASALGVKKIEIENLKEPDKSLQGDAAAAMLFKKLGVDTKFVLSDAVLEIRPSEIAEKLDIDFRDFPDLVLPYAVACLLRGVKFRFEGIGHLRLKESDRIASLQAEASKLGFDVKTGDDAMEWEGATMPPMEDPLIDTHDDHRVAMSFAMAAVKTGRIRIAKPEVVEKSFTDFWNQIETIGLSCRQEKDVMIVEYKKD